MKMLVGHDSFLKSNKFILLKKYSFKFHLLLLTYIHRVLRLFFDVLWKNISFQASRSSLDRMSPLSCTSIGSGGRLRRGFSPHRQQLQQQQQQPASLSIFRGEMMSEEEPTVETPDTPAAATAEDYRSLPAALSERLCIEEVVDSATPDEEDEEQSSAM